MARVCSSARSMHSRSVSERVVRLVVCAPAANVTQARAMPVRDVGRTVGADCNNRKRSSNPFQFGRMPRGAVHLDGKMKSGRIRRNRVNAISGTFFRRPDTGRPFYFLFVIGGGLTDRV